MSVLFRRYSLIVCAGLLLASSLFTVFGPFSSPVSAVEGTYETDTSEINKIRALKYYGALKECGALFKSTIKGDHIDKGPRWWVDDGSNVHIGTLIDDWGDQNGNTGCNGESDSSPGWIEDAFSFFELDIGDNGNDRRTFLTDVLGYTCEQDGSSYTCTNSEADNNNSSKGWLQRIRNESPYLNGKDISTTDAGAMSYYYWYEVVKTVCGGAQSSASSNIVDVTTIDKDGQAKIQKWALKEKLSSSVQSDSFGVGVGTALTGSTRGGGGTIVSCSGAAERTATYANDYRLWLGKAQCVTISGVDNIGVCADGWVHKTDNSWCGKTYTNRTAYIDCARGQLQPYNSKKDPIGLECFIKYPATISSTSAEHGGVKANNNYTVCLTAAIKKYEGNGAYCSITYMNKPEYAACVYGAGLEAAGRDTAIDLNIQDPECTGEDCESGITTSCAIDGIGWIVCPVMTFLNSVLEVSFNFLATNFLSTNVNVLTNDSAQKAWETMRNIANVLFVIFFMIIIYSQLTGSGVSNYGVKKMLPRIVIAAILVNVSYYLCLIAVDLSNILGYSIMSIFENIGTSIRPPDNLSDGTSSGLEFVGVVTAILAGAAGVTMLALSVTAPVLLAAVLALIIILFMLFARTALIVMLAILAPLAFVAFLLPNTQQWFKKWYKLYLSLLLLFPIIALVFGASSLAAQILNNVGANTGGGDGWSLQITALAVATIPLFIVPVLLKGALNGTGALGAKLSGFSSKANSSVGSKVKNESRLGEAMKYRQYKGKLNQAKRRGAVSGFVSKKLGYGDGGIDQSRFGRALGFDRGAAAAEAAVDADFQKNVDNATKGMEHMSGKDVLAIAADAKASAETRAAARQHIMRTGSFEEKRQVLTTVDDASERERTALKSQYFSSGMNEYFGNSLGGAIQSGSIGGDDGLKKAMQANFGNITAQTVTKSGAPAMEYMKKAIQSADASDQLNIRRAIESAQSDVQLRSQISGDAGVHFDEIHGIFSGSSTSPSNGASPGGTSSPSSSTGSTPPPSDTSTGGSSGPTLT